MDPSSLFIVLQKPMLETQKAHVEQQYHFHASATALK
jgi:hypothetical protein